jgi:hypothetical protein
MASRSPHGALVTAPRVRTQTRRAHRVSPSRWDGGWDGESATRRGRFGTGEVVRVHGHAKPSTTVGYVKHLGRSPQSVVEQATAILDDYGRREGAE